MSIEIPSYLQWISYLVGSEWPQGDEDGMWRIGQHWHNASAELTALIPDLKAVRAQTMAALVGETAATADKQFSMLFDGDYAVDKLAQAKSALGKLCDNTGTAIEYAKISILFSLGKAAAEIIYAYATAAETWGASLNTIPITEAFTRYSIRQAIMNMLKLIFGQLDEALKKTLVKELLREGIEDVEWAVIKESTLQGIQMANGHRSEFDWSKLEKSASVAFIGGAVNHGTKEILKDILKLTTQRVVTAEGKLAFREVDNPIEGAIKGALTGYAGGTAASAAGTLSSGGKFEPATLFTSGISSAVKGAASGAAKASSQAQYDPDYYPPGKTASNPFAKPIGWNQPIVAGSLAASSAAAGGAAWLSGHASSSHSGPSSPLPVVPRAGLVTVPIARQPDGRLVGPSGGAGAVADPSGSTSGGAIQMIAAPPSTSVVDPAGAAGDRTTGLPPAATAGNGATASPVATGSPGGSESVATSSKRSSTAAASAAPREVAGPSFSSLTAGPSASDTAVSPAAHLTAAVDPAAAATTPAAAGAPSEGSLDLSSPASPGWVGLVADPGSPAVLDLVRQSGAVSLLVDTPEVPPGPGPDPNSTTPATSDRGPNFGPPNPTPDAGAGLAESVAGGSAVQRPAQPIGPEPAAAGQAGWLRGDAHLLGRGEGTRGDSLRTADPPVTTRGDSAVPDSGRDDSSRSNGARPGKLPRRSGVADDLPDHLRPAAAIRTPNPRAAASDS